MNRAIAVEAASTTNDRSKAPELLYRPMDFFMVRAPLLPVQSYLDVADPQRQMSLVEEANVQRALAVGSPSLIDALERSRSSTLSQRDAERMRAKLLRYQIRMSTRPTPFGMFAGAAVAQWGSNTDLNILSTCARTRMRPDMAWLMDFVVSTEAIAAVRKQLRLFTNPLAAVEAGRVFLSTRAPGKKEGQVIPVSVRASGIVKLALLLARTPLTHQDLVTRLCEASESATPEKVEKLLTDLWEQTFLLTDLRPPLTTDSPARYVAERLAAIPEAADAFKRLQALMDASNAWDRCEAQTGVESFREVLKQAGSPSDGSQGTPVQVDMAMSVEGRLGNIVAEESARAAELLLRLSPSPYGLSNLSAYRQAYVNRYGQDREIALLELMDPNRGMGPMSNYGHAAVGPDAVKAAQRAQTLLQLACAALHDRQRIVDLDERSLTQLETWHPNIETAPVSLDINVLVGAASSDAIDTGDFTMVVGPNLGAQAAGRNLARFVDLLAPDGSTALMQTAAAEQSHFPDALLAEFVYLPTSLRSANVIIRPPIRTYEVAVDVSAGVPHENIIPLDELVVGVEQGRFHVRWPAAGKRVIFFSGHMLNYHQAPAVGRFLMDLSADGKVMFSSFDWGSAESFPYLPRIQSGRIVLRPAQWLIHKTDLQTDSPQHFRAALSHWRTKWDVPKHVCMGFGDNRLILDLDQEAQAAELSAELHKLPENNSIIVQEVLPALNEAWLTGPGGRYYSEFIVSLVLRPKIQLTFEPSSISNSRTAHTSVPPTVSNPALLQTAAGTEQPSRNHAPGSEWLFVKLYCHRNLDDDVISESILVFAENAVISGLASSWFFVRYADPEAHLRLRFHGSPDRLITHLLPHICEWAGRLMSTGLCVKFMFDTYEQEVERFGGHLGMAAAEAIFAADSSSAAALVRCLKRKLWPHDQTTLLVLSIDDLLSSLGYDESERLSWYETQTKSAKIDISAEYRQRKTVLRLLLGQSEKLLANEPGGPEIASILATRRNAVSAANDLRKFADQGVLSQSLDTLASSLVHLHLNRMAGLDGASEQRILNLLLRTRKSLKNAPVTYPSPD